MRKTTRDDGGSAFPWSGSDPDGSAGMSLRDYFAAKAMALGGEFFHSIDDHGDPPNEAEHVARVAYAIADALLAERQQ